MNTIGKFRFVFGIVVVGAISSFLLASLFDSVLSINQPTSSTAVIIVTNLIADAIAILISFYYALRIKKYKLPGSSLEISLWVGIVFFLLSLIIQALLALAMGSTNIFSFISVSFVGSTLIGTFIVFASGFLSIKLFDR